MMEIFATARHEAVIYIVDAGANFMLEQCTQGKRNDVDTALRVPPTGHYKHIWVNKNPNRQQQLIQDDRNNPRIIILCAI